MSAAALSPSEHSALFSAGLQQDNGTTLSSLVIGMIVLCAICGLVLAVGCTLLIRKRYSLFHSPSSSSSSSSTLDIPPPPIQATPTQLHPMANQQRRNSKKRLSLFLSRTKSTLSSFFRSNHKGKQKEFRTTLDDIPLPPPPPTSAYLASSLPLPPPALTTTAMPTNKLSSIPTSSLSTPDRPQGRQSTVYEEGYDRKALLSPQYRNCHPQQNYQYQHHNANNDYPHKNISTSSCTLTNTSRGSSSFVDDPSLIESLEREQQVKDIYRQHRPTPSWASSNHTTINIQPRPQSSNAKDLSLISLSLAEKQHQEDELQRLSVASYHVW